jgi:hypothetical protein
LRVRNNFGTCRPHSEGRIGGWKANEIVPGGKPAFIPAHVRHVGWGGDVASILQSHPDGRCQRIVVFEVEIESYLSGPPLLRGFDHRAQVASRLTYRIALVGRDAEASCHPL